MSTDEMGCEVARGRMVSKSLFGSKKFAKLTERQALLYVMVLTHSDVKGRFEADPETLQVNSGRLGLAHSWSAPGLIEDLDALHAVGLIDFWRVGEDSYGEIVDFSAHNTVRVDREAESKIPDNPSRRTPGARREDSRKAPTQVKGEVKAQVKKKTTSGDTSPKVDTRKQAEGKLKHDFTARFCAIWKTLFGKSYTVTRKDLGAIRDYGGGAALVSDSFPSEPEVRKAIEHLGETGMHQSLAAVLGTWQGINESSGKKDQPKLEMYRDLTGISQEGES
jgi:hypothetical protein